MFDAVFKRENLFRNIYMYYLDVSRIVTPKSEFAKWFTAQHKIAS